MQTPSGRAEQATDAGRGSQQRVETGASGECAASARPRHARVTLFSVSFKSRMTDADLARLHSTLDLVTYMSPKPGVSGASPGVAPLDFWSGVFLERGAGEDEWVLEGRSWGNPPASAVHEWHVRAALAARELDPSVEIPPREPVPEIDAPSLPRGHAANKRLARLRRRLVGLE